MSRELNYVVSPDIDSLELNRLFQASWSSHAWTDFSYLKNHSLCYVCCYDGADLVGFVNLAWDGNRHAFLLDTTVDRQYQRKGIGGRLVSKALQVARENNVEWVHVDYEAVFDEFYRKCGFKQTLAGLVHVLG